jgi:molybdopterin converting factor small subunit
MAKQAQKEIKKSSPKKKAPESQEVSTKKPSVKSAVSKIDKVLSNNDIMFGSEHLKLPLIGKTVADIRKELKHVLNVPEGAQARVNSKLVDDNYVIKEEDVIEFVKVSGQKG